MLPLGQISRPSAAVDRFIWTESFRAWGGEEMPFFPSTYTLNTELSTEF